MGRVRMVGRGFNPGIIHPKVLEINVRGEAAIPGSESNLHPDDEGGIHLNTRQPRFTLQ
jgi:hypothetical protein